MECQWTVLEAGKSEGRTGPEGAVLFETYRSVQETAAELEISEHTLRYYEKLGLLGSIARSSAGRRVYTPANLDRLRFILRLRAGPLGGEAR